MRRYGVNNERSWYWRRWALFSSLAVLDFVILYLTVWGADNRLSQDAMTGAQLAVVAIVNGYVFGGLLDDRYKGKEKIAQAAVENSAPVTTETNVEIKQ